MDLLFSANEVIIFVTDRDGYPVEIEWMCGCRFKYDDDHKLKSKSICERHADSLLPGDAPQHPRYFSR